MTKSPDDWMPFNIIISYALVEIPKTVSLSLFTQKLTIVHSKLRENASGLNSIVLQIERHPHFIFNILFHNMDMILSNKGKTDLGF